MYIRNLCVCLRAYLRNYTFDRRQIFPLVIYGRGSVMLCSAGVAICCVFPVLWLTSCLHVMVRNRRREKDVYSKRLDMTQHGFERSVCIQQGEVTSQNLWSRWDRHFVGVTRRNTLSEMAKICRVIQIKLYQLV